MQAPPAQDHDHSRSGYQCRSATDPVAQNRMRHSDRGQRVGKASDRPADRIEAETFRTKDAREQHLER